VTNATMVDQDALECTRAFDCVCPADAAKDRPAPDAGRSAGRLHNQKIFTSPAKAPIWEA